MLIQGRVSLTMLVGVLLSATAFASEPEAVPGEFVVKLRPSVSVQSLSFATMSKSLGGFVKSTIPEHNIVVVQRPVFEIATAAVKTMNENPMVEVAEPNFIYRINKTPNDPKLELLWGLKNVGQKDSANQVGTAGVDIDAEKAWDIQTGSKDILVAVIDTGVDYNHADLKENVAVNVAELNGQPGVDDDGNGYVDDAYGMNFTESTRPTPNGMDDHGHGSHCSGTIGGRGDDGAGIVGVAWNVRILPVKFLSAQGGGTLEGAIKAIDYATKMGAKIMSNSWGGGGFSQTLKEAIERSHQAGALFVAAAGNDSANNDSRPTYPASYDVPNILTVAAIDNRGNMAYFSNYGKRSVHLAAPGVNVYSSTTNGGYDSWSGTSMATPHVSGVAALLASNEPQLTGMQLKERLIATVRPMASIASKVKTGGMINAYNALTNTMAPPDVNDPANWSKKSVSVSSAHPYSAKINETYEVQVDGAKEISLYFSRFETERNYDKVTLFNRAGEKVGELSGSMDDSYSPVIAGDYVRMVFTSDDSVQGHGFDVTQAAYR